MITVSYKFFRFILCCIVAFIFTLEIYSETGIIKISADQNAHVNYGLSYPVTYKFTLQARSSYKVYKRYNLQESWIQITEKSSNDFYNGVEAVRFDIDKITAYVSVAFSGYSDDVFLKFTDGSGNAVTALYAEICKYYDDREAAVTSSADDWNDDHNEVFKATCDAFYNAKIWLTAGIITGASNPTTWADIGNKIDQGYIEPASHSRTHPNTPYSDVESEIAGSKENIINNLDLPDLFKSGINEYVYTWIEPYSHYDSSIYTEIGINRYLISRGNGDNDFSAFKNFNATYNFFERVLASLHMDQYEELDDNYDIYNTIQKMAIINGRFDNIVQSGGIYHFWFHPLYYDWENEEENLILLHLNHIKNRNNIWYVSLGHLYLYHLLQSQNVVSVTGDSGIMITSPNGGEEYKIGKSYTVTWNSEGITNESIGLKLFQNGISLGYITTYLPNTGSYNWTISGLNGGISILPGSNYKIQVRTMSGTLFKDLSDNTFTILQSGPPSLNMMSPNGGESFSVGNSYPISWDSEGISVSIGLKLVQNDISLGYFATYLPNTGSYTWTISDLIGGTNILPGNNYEIELRTMSGTVIKDRSDSVFTINPPPLILTSPNGGESITLGSTYEVTWESFGIYGSIVLKLYQNNVSLGCIQTYIPNTGSYFWTVSGLTDGSAILPGNNYQIEVRTMSGTVIKDKSDGYITIISN